MTTKWVDRNGYEFWRPELHGPCLAAHRVLAFAWGMIDSPFIDQDPRHIDHCRVPVHWLNAEWNLQAMWPDEHARAHRAREQQVAPSELGR